MFFKSRSIVGRLSVWYICSSFFLIFLSTGYLYWTLSKALTAEDHAVLRGRVRTLNSILKRKEDPIGSIRRRIESEWISQDYQPLFVKIIDQKNNIIIQSPQIPEEVDQEIFPNSPTFQSTEPLSPIIPFPSGKSIITQSGHPYITLTQEFLKNEKSPEIKKIYLALNLNNERNILNHYRAELFLVLGLSLFLCTLIGIKISQAGFKPVKEIIAIAEKIQPTTLHERISFDRLPLELRALANTMNAMLDRLETSFDRLSRFSSDISHELRTPVNNLRGEIEVSLAKPRSTDEYQDLLQSSLEETVRISRIIDSLLFLAKAENPVTQIQKESVNLKLEIDKIVEFYEPTATEEGIEIRTHIRESTFIHVERTLFQRAVGNIVANAINYTARGGAISISEIEADSQVRLFVKDTGKGIDAAHLPLIFDRFYRADSSRTATKLGGFGLGLTIVKSILKLHGGEISIQSQLNQGTEVCLAFPK